MALQIVVKRELSRADAQELGPDVRVLTGHTVVPCTEEELDGLLDRFRAEPIFVRLSHWETGGAHQHTGVSQIVCSPEGEALKPVRVRNSGELANSRHALFVGRDLVTVLCEQDHREVKLTITRRWVDDELRPHQRVVCEAEGEFLVRPVDDFTALVDGEEYAEWVEYLPRRAHHLRRPIYRGIEKSLCYHCREPHFCHGGAVCDRAVPPRAEVQIGHA